MNRARLLFQRLDVIALDNELLDRAASLEPTIRRSLVPFIWRPPKRSAMRSPVS